MTSPELDNLVKIGKLKREPPVQQELAGLRASAESRLADAGVKELSYEGRFDLAYGAAHAFALIALRRLGYRSNNRYLVFQMLPHTAGFPAASTRVLVKAHERRNAIEYEGATERDERLLTELIETARALRQVVEKLSKDSHQ